MIIKVKKIDDVFDKLLSNGQLIIEEEGISRQLGRILNEFKLRDNVIMGYDRQLKKTIVVANFRKKRRRKTWNGSVFEIEL